jgi:diguanylate cyclase (GGDEF)-like protein
VSDIELNNAGERPRVLLVGDVSARPYGMERALSRAGFHVIEAASPAQGQDDLGGKPDVAVVTAGEADDAFAVLVQALHAAWGGQVPLIAVLGSPDREGPARALGLGADDAVASPVHLPELCARVETRARRRLGDRMAGNGRVQELLLDLIEHARIDRRPAEVLEALAERAGRTLPRWEVAFVLADDPAEGARILAGSRGVASRDLRLDVERYPELAEALRTGRPVVVTDVQTDPLFEAARRRWSYEGTEVPIRGVAALPMSAADRTVGVLLLRTREPDARLSPSEEIFAMQVARAAARVVDADRRAPVEPRGAPSNDPLTGLPTTDALDRRILEESERAKRYSLSFSLVLLDVDEQEGLNTRLGRPTGDRLLAELGRMLQREVRASDFVARYGGDEFALVLAETGAHGARELVHRVRARLGVESFAGLPAGERPRVTAGIVGFPHPAVEEADDLLVLLEAALRRGKAQAEERIGVAE